MAGREGTGNRVEIANRVGAAAVGQGMKVFSCNNRARRQPGEGAAADEVDTRKVSPQSHRGHRGKNAIHKRANHPELLVSVKGSILQNPELNPTFFSVPSVTLW
jgi:hypothetical protein